MIWECCFRFWGIPSSEMPSHVNGVKSSFCSGFLKDGLSILWFFVLWVFVCLFSSCRNLKITLLVSFLFHHPVAKGTFPFFSHLFSSLRSYDFQSLATWISCAFLALPCSNVLIYGNIFSIFHSCGESFSSGWLFQSSCGPAASSPRLSSAVFADYASSLGGFLWERE